MDTIPKILSKEITDKYSILDNTFIGKDKGEVAEERQVEIGDVMSDDFQPQAKLAQWENETNFSVRLKHTEKNIRIETDGDKIKWKGRKVEAHFYDVEKTKDLPKAFELEVLLLEKPKTNKVKFTTQSKGLKFYYQPELTQKEKDEGAFRPENVVGSYAVYHESKQGDYSKMGLKNYRAGKAFHIYRPKIIDSAGKEVWGKLNITDNLLTVEIPQEFLDNAVYPVRHAAGLTLGYTTTGDSTANWGGNTIRAIYPFTASANGPITQTNGFSYARGTNANNDDIRPVIYKNSDDTIVDYGPAVTPPTTAGWYNASFNQGGSLVNGTAYMVGVWIDGFATELKYDTVSNVMARDAHTYHATNAPPSPCDWDAGKPWGNYKISIYATYTAGGATQKEVTDVGSGADAVSISCNTPVSDSGSGADIASILASMNLTDTGSGADTISITQLKSLLETGSGADIISLITKLNVVDTGAGSEVISLLGKIAQTDTGLGSEALSVLSKLATITDTGSGADALTVLVAIALTDTGAGAEALSILYKIAQTDTGVGSEIISILNQFILTDAGVGVDVADKTDIGSEKLVNDSGTGSEALSILTQLAMTDTGTGLEAVSALIKLSESDSGTGLEIINILSQVLQTDTGSGSEALEILRQIIISDSGTASDAIIVLVQLAISETASGVDVASVSGNIKEIVDTGIGSDALNILVKIAITDATTGIEILNVLNQMAVTDTGSGADVIDKTALDTKDITDSGSGADVVAFAKQLVLQDSGVGADTIAKQKIVAAVATILSALGKNANIKLTNQVKAKIKSIINN